MDPYVYPETDVLQNRRGIRDDVKLRAFEADATTRRLIELRKQPLLGSFETAHLREIHRYIFQDVYSWAGELRTVNISRGGQFPYAFVDRIEGALNGTFSQLAKERHLKSLGRGEFVARAAHYLGEINAIHPFREGNGRTQREFLRQLAEKNGYLIDWSRISQSKMYEASRMSFQHSDNSGLETSLKSAIRADPQSNAEAKRELLRLQARARDVDRER